METVSISPKFQVVIPKSIRKPLGIRAGMKVQVLVYGDRIELLPIRTAQSLRGYLKSIDTRVKREKDRV